MTDKKKETKAFRTETKKMLDIMIHSVYTEKEIFLRELISNSADAIDKLKFKALKEPELIRNSNEFKIEIEINKENRTLCVKDNGIGMTYAEVNNNIGTIAASGTQKFLEKIKDKNSTLELIGQFGVGFYSSFIVADKVRLITKSPEGKGVIWESAGEGQYTIEETDKEERGTEVILHIREGEEFEEFLGSYKIEELVKKYSDYVQYPVIMEYEETVEEGEKEVKTKTLNSMKPIWKKPSKEIDAKEYNDFYKSVFHDFSEPLDVIHTKAEGLSAEYTSLMYVPKNAPFNYYHQDYRPNIRLYSKNVMIMKNCEGLLPDYMNFVRGIVDSSDFSLNISRETLQKNTTLKIIGKSIEKNILRSLKNNLEEKRTVYEEWWDEFGTSIKYGIYQNPQKQDDLKELLLFHSTGSDEKRTLKEYTQRMKDGQDKIYYLVTSNRNNAKNLPQLEAIEDKGFEALILIDPIDEFVINILDTFDEKPFSSLNKIDEEPQKEEMKNLMEAIKNSLGGKITEVKLSSRLKKSPVCLVTSQNGISLQTERVLKALQDIPLHTSKILEINPEHPVFEVMKEEFEKDESSELIPEYSHLLYAQAMLIEGLGLENAPEFSSKVSELMVKAARK